MNSESAAGGEALPVINAMLLEAGRNPPIVQRLFGAGHPPSRASGIGWPNIDAVGQRPAVFLPGCGMLSSSPPRAPCFPDRTAPRVHRQPLRIAVP